MSDDLIAFNTARINEDEAVAKRAGGEDDGDYHWRQVDPDRRPGRIEAVNGNLVVWDEGSPDVDQAEHIARYDPGRALREVAAKRERLAAYIAARAAAQKDGDPYMAGVADGLGVAVKGDAATWNDHPDYRSEWAS